MSIYEMTNTPEKRETLSNLSDSEKLKLIYDLTDSTSIIEVLDFIGQSNEDSDWCNSYR